MGKRRTFPVSFHQVELKGGAGINGGRILNSFERDVYSAIAVDSWDKTIQDIDFQGFINTLTVNERSILQLVRLYRCQRLVAKALNITPQAVSKVFCRIKRKGRLYYGKGCGQKKEQAVRLAPYD